ncbi:PKD domain-containing protein [Pseudoalteromonas sp. T1lg65]|uniref:PKD domain-containing protein n=1 Tax=Pseudoalteromonas sp. T1lg65 TaxID=2077101 RepID=UPI003F792869
MKPTYLLPVLGLLSGSVMANAPLTEAQMMKYTSKVNKAVIGEKYALNLALVGSDGPVSGQHVITQEISHPGASYIKLHFKNLDLSGGGKLVVRSDETNERYVYTEQNMRASTVDTKLGDDGQKQFFAMSVSADKAIVEYTPGNGNKKQIPEVDFYYYGTENTSSDDFDGLSTCGANERRDVQCWANSHPEEFERSRPVARLLMNGSGLCTGWRVGSDNRMFTNNHCVETAGELSNTEVWFNYQATSCNGSQRETVVKVTGKDFLATDYTLDYTLFTINDFEKAAPFGYFGLDVRNASQGERIYIPQHGSGNPKELSIESDKDADGLCSVNVASEYGRGADTDIGYYCDTIGGSSGSPVIAAATKNAIALHHFGGCTNQGVKISRIWPQVSNHFGGVVPIGDNGPVTPDPVAQFSYTCSDLSCSFDGAASSSPNGPISAHDWSFGDGATASGSQVNHTFPTAGTYTVELSVTDTENRTANTMQEVVVTTQPDDEQLQKRQPVTGLSGASGDELFFYYDAPEGVSQVTFYLSAGSGDADLYVRKDSKPTTGNWDCRPYRYGNLETCKMTQGGGRYWVMIRGYTSFSGVQIMADHNN